MVAENLLKIVKKSADMSVGKKNQTGQAAIEFIFVLPVLFLLMLWTYQFFYAVHTGSVNQKYARIELMNKIQNHRDLRFAERFSQTHGQDAYSNDGYMPNTLDYMSYSTYKDRFFNKKTFFAVSVSENPGGENSPVRIVGEPELSEGQEVSEKNRIKVRTTVGICRDEVCK
jgi:hypothetical protein